MIAKTNTMEIEILNIFTKNLNKIFEPIEFKLVVNLQNP
jgi:hypothetical protein